MFYFNLIKDIKENISIIFVISKYVKIKKINNYFLGLCPFHLERNPSFYVDEKKKNFYCFGCKSSGDLIHFLMKIKNYNFKIALKYILENYKKFLKNDYCFNNYLSNISYNEYYLLNKLSVVYFKNNLYKNQTAIEYLKKRNVSSFLIKKFNIGFLDKNCKKFYDYLLLKDINTEVIKKSNLFYNIDNSINSIFSNRIIFSIYDSESNIVAFGGRAISENILAKYVNSKNGLFYQKKNFFFGLEYLKISYLDKDDFLLLSEGYFDFFALNSLGYRVISLLGSNINFDKIVSILFSYKCVIFCFDSDKQGINTFLNSLEFFFLNFSGKIFQVEFSFFKDPFLYYENNSAHLLLYEIKNKKDAFEFFIFYYFSNYYIIENSEYVFNKIFVILKIIFFRDYILYCKYLNYISSIFNLEIYKIEHFFNNFLNNIKEKKIIKNKSIIFSINDLEFFFCIINHNKLIKLVFSLKIFAFNLTFNFIDFLNKIFFLYFINGFVNFNLISESFIKNEIIKNTLKKIYEINYMNNYFICRAFVYEFFKFKTNRLKGKNEKKNS